MRLLVALGFILMVSSANAEIRPGFMADFSIGRSQYSTDSEPDAAFSAQLAYQINTHFAIEGQFVGLGLVTPMFAGWFEEKVKYTPESYYGISLVGNLPLNERFDLYAKLGVGRTLFSSSQKKYADYSETDTNLGAGTRMRLGQNWSMKFEGQYFNKAKVSTWLLGVGYHF
ncbi:porin family protein [Iodobacter fluviatilis]|uniref:Attachment invasion locus protein n=1 Tax=Iodobacter fluviatilis TaxID=537 RepID=A0A377Q9H6_9NEIS|nr:porin family protein [Iodobacter fluviatilis]TCU88710.1 outer membrane protein with beta-barrel domain [Iodobacter fluviatilis]STQ91219.1 Attachment invasion locus protein precursor [Iodobacter fluviatilis]